MICFLAGYGLSSYRQDSSIEKVRIRVTGDWTVNQDLKPHSYRIECADPIGCVKVICPDSVDPGFDIGDVLDVEWKEESLPDGGMCDSFRDLKHTHWQLVREEMHGLRAGN